MPIEQIKIRRIFRLGCYIALGVFFVCLPFVEPFRIFIGPSVEKFVEIYIEILLNLLYGVFFTCSLTLVILASLAHGEYRRSRAIRYPYRSELIVSNYYKPGKKQFDFGKAISSVVSSHYPQRGAGNPNSVDEVKPDGTYQTFYPGGQLEKEFTYKGGKLNGLFRLYYEDGILHQEKYYKDGKLHGTFRAFDDQGVMFFETNYKDGQKNGMEKNYFSNGSIQYLDTYKDGIMINRKTYNELGELQFDYDYHEEQ